MFKLFTETTYTTETTCTQMTCGTGGAQSFSDYK